MSLPRAVLITAIALALIGCASARDEAATVSPDASPAGPPPQTVFVGPVGGVVPGLPPYGYGQQPGLPRPVGPVEPRPAVPYATRPPPDPFEQALGVAISVGMVTLNVLLTLAIGF